MRDIDLSLTDPSFFANGDPHPLLATLRREDPVHWTQGHLSRGFWSITRHADVKTVLLNDNRVFSVQRNGASLPAGADMEDPENSYFVKLSRSGAQISVMDGRPHTQLRSLFSDRFSPKGIARLDKLVRDCTRDIFNRVLEKGECDFTTAMAGRLPLVVIGAMMNIPDEESESLYMYNNMMAAPEDPEWSLGDTVTTSTAGTTGLMEYLTRLALERRKNPGDDLISQIALAQLDGQPLSDIQLGFNGLMFFSAGHETTRASLSAGLLELLRDPAQLEALRAARHDATALAIAGEEMVRWTSPLTHTLRTATEDFTLGGTQIREGDWVVPWFISANRDELAFADAGRFDAARDPNPHIGFATGKHFCIGAHLARLEMRVMLEYLLEYLDDLELAGPVEMAASNLFWGIKHMPIRFRRRAKLGDGDRLAA